MLIWSELLLLMHKWALWPMGFLFYIYLDPVLFIILTNLTFLLLTEFLVKFLWNYASEHDCRLVDWLTQTMDNKDYRKSFPVHCQGLFFCPILAIVFYLLDWMNVFSFKRNFSYMYFNNYATLLLKYRYNADINFR